MTNLDRAKSLAETTLRTYEDVGRKLPEDMETWTPADRALLKRTRDAYHTALATYNELRGANGAS